MDGQQFILHAGARPATFQELSEIVLPEKHPSYMDKVGSYRTLPHHILAQHVRNTIRTFIDPEAILSEHYAISTAPSYPGAKLFGMMKIDLGDTTVEEAARLAQEFAADAVEAEVVDEEDGDVRNYRGAVEEDHIMDPHDDLDEDGPIGLDQTEGGFEDSDDWGGSKVMKSDSLTPALFFRNSYDKSMSVAAAFGYQVFACDNLAVSGDLAYRRSHTKNMLKDVIATVSVMVQAAGRQHAFDQECKKALSGMEIKDIEGWRILGEMAGSGALNIANGTKSQYATALMEWNDPTFDCFKPRTMWSLYNAVTFALRMSGITKRLEGASNAHQMFLAHLGEAYIKEAADINREFAEAVG